MRKFTLLILSMALCVLCLTPTLIAQDDAQTRAIQRLQAASQETVRIWFNQETGVPRFITMKVRGSGATADRIAYQFLTDYAAIFRMTDPTQQLVVKSRQTDRLGMSHVRMSQTANGLRVFGRELIVHIDRAGNVYAVNGEFAPDVNIGTARPGITAERAINIATNDTGSSASQQPTAELLVYENRLAYEVEILVDGPNPADWIYFIDARNGTILHRYDDLQDADAVGTGNSLYRGTVSINTDQGAINFSMVDNPRGVTTRDAHNSSIRGGTIFRDADNVWGDGTKANRQSAAVDAHWGVAQTLDYYANTHGRNSYDDAGASVKVVVHYSNNYVNAFWDGRQLVFGDGDGSLADPLVELDIAAHELTHAVTDFTADLIYQNQSGALNESVSDVFAMMVDRDDFLIGEDSWTPGTPGDALRYMNDPTLGNQPKHMQDFVVTTQDNGGVHINSGIPNFAAYLATAGGVGKLGDAVTGIGRNKVEQIWYRALSVYMTPSTDFNAARANTIQAATDLFGGGSAEVQTIMDAWTAVGVLAPSLAAPALPVVTRAALSLDGQPLLATGLGSAFPSPANPEVWIPYQLGSETDVTVRIHDALGRLVRTLELGPQQAGIYDSRSTAAYWDGHNNHGEVISSGVYFYTLSTDDFTATRKLIILR